MIRGIYTSAAGMATEQVRSEVTTNNLANVNTAGFKKDTAIVKTFPEMLLSRINDPDKTKVNPTPRPLVGKIGTGSIVDEIVTVHSLGQIKETGSPLDLAISGPGFFVVETPQGERYTRNGVFQLNGEGLLVTAEGYQVQGQIGAIPLQQGGQVTINESGQVLLDGQLVDKIRVVDFNPETELTKEGNSLFRGPAPDIEADVRLLQGYQELSNVNPITEMVNLITVMRTYEMNQKSIQSHDQLLDKAVNEVGRLG